MEVNRNKDASARGENTHTSSTGMNYDNGSSTFREGSEDAQQFFNVIGEGGSTRHTGYFSSNNPYFNQLGVASNNQDKDALYELSVQWEADYANRQMQLEENKAILDEQRAYDSPLAQVQRQRAAGINPDLAAAGSGSGSSSGSSAQLTNPGMADQTGQTKFSNAYDNANLIFAGINTAANFIGTLSNVAGTVVDSVCKLNLLDPQRNLISAQAGLVNAQAGEVNTLLAGKKTSQDINNSSAYLQQLASVAQLTSADTTDENMTPFLRGIGLTEEQLPDALNIVRQMHSNPAALAKFYGDTNNMRANKARTSVYTQDVLDKLTDTAYKIENERLVGEFHMTNLKSSIAEILDNPDFVSKSAAAASSDIGLHLEQNQVAGEALKVSKQELKTALASAKNNYDTFMYQIAQRAALSRQLQMRRGKLMKKFNENEHISFEEQAALDGLDAEIIALQSLNSEQFNQMHRVFLNYAFKSYMSHSTLWNNTGYYNNGAVKGTDSYRKSLADFAGTTINSIIPTGITSEGMQFEQSKFYQQMDLARDQYYQKWVDVLLPF